MAADPDPECRAELGRLLNAGDQAELRDRFASELGFGTAGLRALVGAGPNRINRAVVARATAGLCAYLKQAVPDAPERGICIGRDGRHTSAELAEETAVVAAGAGFRTLFFEAPVPTPLLAFSVLDRRAAAGVMITASHNAARYNGYKVYWGNGAQIIPPHDTGIAAAIAAQGPAVDLPRLPAGEAVERGLRQQLDEELTGRYLQGVCSVQLHPELPRDLRIAYTPMHGVGGRLALRAFAQAGFRDLHVVSEQAEPDGDFPTVTYPNPEDAGAMERVLRLGSRVGADLVVAHDPDADRLALAAPGPDGRLAVLSGNQVGILLAHYLLEQGETGPERLVVSTLVSTPLIEEVARFHGARWECTLTGFKWICNRALELERETGARFVFGFEEALGYAAGTLVRDKDGIGSAVLAADLAAWCKQRGVTLHQELERAARLYGMVHSRSLSLSFAGLGAAEAMNRAMDRVRASVPDCIGAYAVEALSDLRTGVRRRADRVEEPIALPSSDVLLFELEGGHRVILRPSGTEPKLKLYFDLRRTPHPAGEEDIAAQRAERDLQQLLDAFLRYLQ